MRYLDGLAPAGPPASSRPLPSITQLETQQLPATLQHVAEDAICSRRNVCERPCEAAGEARGVPERARRWRMGCTTSVQVADGQQTDPRPEMHVCIAIDPGYAVLKPQLGVPACRAPH